MEHNNLELIKNDKHKLFADEYLSNGFNATAAYVSAGYVDKNPNVNAQRLLKIPTIIEYIRNAQSAIAKKQIVTRDELMEDLKNIKDNWLAKKPLIAIKAIETLNRMAGFNEPDKVDHTTNGQNITPLQINIQIIK